MGIKDRLGKLTDAIGITEATGSDAPQQDYSPPATTLSIEHPILSSAPPVTTAPGDIDEVRKSIEGDLAKGLPEAYAAFEALLDGLAEVIPDEGTRIKAALVGAGKQGFTPKSILSSFDDRSDAVDTWEKSFEDSVKRKLSTDVVGLENQAADADRQTKAKQEEIAKLQAELQELATARVQAQNNAQAARDKISAGAKRVKAALGAIRDSINREKMQVANFVKGGR